MKQPVADAATATPDELELDLELPTFDLPEPDLALPKLPEADLPAPPLTPISVDQVAAPAVKPVAPMSQEEKRIKACLDIGRQKRREALPMLVQLVTEGASNLVEHACWSLGELGDPSAVDALILAMKEHETPVKVKAVEALGKIGAFTAIPKVVEYIPKADDKTKMAIVDCLVAIGGPQVKKGLVLLSRDFNSSVSGRAHDALVSL